MALDTHPQVWDGTVLVSFRIRGLWMVPHFFQRRLRSCYKTQQEHFRQTLSVASLGSIVLGDDATAHFPWSAFESWLETPEVFLLF
jgi:hypothetical protein